MMIFQHTWKAVLNGTKTQTRRLVKPYTSYLKYTEADGETINAVLQNNREQWRVGKTYAVQPGRGQKAIGRIRITGIRQERLQDIIIDDVRAEGFASTYHFSKQWEAIHTSRGERWEDDPPVWVIEFELVKGDE